MKYLHLLLGLAASGCAAASPPTLRFRQQAEGDTPSLFLENGYLFVSFDGKTSTLTFGADFSGGGSYTPVLAKPYGLHAKYLGGETTSSGPNTAEPVWVTQSEDELTVRIPGITDGGSDSLVNETWTLSVRRGQRFVSLNVRGKSVRAADDVVAVYHGLYMKSSSIYGLFDDRGVAQMMNKTHACLGSDQAMSRAYVMGNGVAMDYVRPGSAARKVVLSTMSRDGYQTGIEDIMLGSYPDLSLEYASAWGECWRESALAATAISAGTSYSATLMFMPNDFDFPVYLLSDVASQPKMPFNDIRTYLTGIYGSPAGCLQGYFDRHEGTIAPTISHPDVGYSPDTNFFDPDNFISLSALMYSGDTFFLQEVRKVLERTSNTMCGLGSEQVEGYCGGARVSALRLTSASALRFGTPMPGSSNRRAEAVQSGRDGQLMHHFVNLVPTYESIAGSEQLGPNVFWTWSCLRYISVTQDYNWAIKMFPYIDLSVKYLLTFYDESRGMISAPGPLWIDVLVRENYTSDSNAIMVPFLQLAADAYEMYEEIIETENSASMHQFANELRSISSTIAVTMATELWDKNSNDHFITQLDPSGETRDFVDYDSNLLAVAFGAVSLGSGGNEAAALSRMTQILARVDAGNYTHIRATWCSEKPYSGDACDCYIVGGDVCGDSVVTLARIGWADSHARKLVGDINAFDSLLLAPLQEDLVKDIWLYERYDDAGSQIRTAYYFEYPSLIAMMLREIRYGLSIGLRQVEVFPFMNLDVMEKEFVYSFGETYLSYASEKVELRLPSFGSTTRAIKIKGIFADSTYVVSGCSQDSITVKTDDQGTLKFEWLFPDSSCTVSVELL